MAKRSWIKALVISLVSVCLVAAGVLVTVWFAGGYKTIIIYDIDCPYMFDCTPQELFSKDLKELGLPESLLDHAKINKDDDLVLYLSKKQQQEWKDSPFMDIVGKDPFIEITPNYKQITVFGYEEYVTRDAKKSFTLIDRMIVMQVLNGTPQEEAQIRYILKDGKTGHIFFMGLYPDEDIDLKLTQWKFSYYKDYDFIFED